MPQNDYCLQSEQASASNNDSLHVMKSDNVDAGKDQSENVECRVNAAITDSNEVHIGNQTVYHGPVTIRQILKRAPTNDAVILEKIGSDCNNERKLEPEEKNDPIRKNKRRLLTFSRRNIAILACSAIFLAVLLVVVVLLTTSKQELIFVSREEWSADSPTGNLTLLPSLPVPYVIIHHTATENCSTQEICSYHTKNIQEFHMGSRGWDDIGYNFLLGGDGRVYEGRGWIVQGAHTYGFNYNSIGIAFIGTFNNIRPPEVQLKSCKQLIELGVKLMYIKEDYGVLGARQLHTTQSPGNELYKEIKTWSHWVANP